MMRASKASDYVLATGETHSIREFVEIAGRVLGFDIEWRGTGVDEVGVERASGREIVRVNRTYFRPAEVDVLIGDASRARRELGWSPKVSFPELVEAMCRADLKRVEASK
jgi:GDPmannose 4,6-dehydratase